MELSKKIGLSEGQIILIGIVVWILIICVLLGAVILVLFISVLYPCLKSIQALETKENEEDDKVWLTYWCVFGIFNTMDDFLGFVLESVPFYFYIKVGFFIWMMLPTTQGAAIIYNQAMKPFMKKHGHKFQKIVNDISEGAKIVENEAMK